MLHGVLTSLLTALGAASLVLVLSIPPDTWLSWPAGILCMILDGWFFQPLGCLIDSAIIKILGDYKLLFESERRWGKLSLGVTALGIGCFLDDDHDFDTLMGTVVIGCAALFLLSLSTTVQPADPLLLGLPSSSLSEEERSMETSPLMLSKSSLLPHYLYGDHPALPPHPHQQVQRQSIHHHYHHYHHHYHHQNNSPPLSSNNCKRSNSQDHHQYQETIDGNNYKATTRKATVPRPSLDSTSSPSYYYHYSTYKPYSLFGDHLSHISEEDASMLQRIPSTPPRAPSLSSIKTKNSLNHLLDNSTFQFTAMPPSPPTPLPSQLSDAGLHSAIHTVSIESQQSPQSPIPSSLSPQHHMTRGNDDDGIYFHSKGDSPTTSNTITVTSSLMDTSFKSMALALLPFPPGDIPMIVLITLFPRLRPDSFRPQQQSPPPSAAMADLEYCGGRDKSNDEDDEQQSYHIAIMVSCFMLGLIYALMVLWAPLIYCDYFGLPMHTIGLIILAGCLSDIMVTHSAPLALEHLSLRNSVLLAHLVLMISIFAYAWIPSGQQQWWSLIGLFILHIMQSSSILMIWLLASYQVDLLFLPHCQDRMMLRGKMSALYSSAGPAIGSLALGWLVTLEWSIPSIYLFTLLLIPPSASLTLAWS
ncbi:hypothetical protein BC941DRAFT_208050 [Chlamydoabsidia padenii]|nr:hypothetical protein BC941DRAFT_208050 [Chlamydoabsidia padenii]